MLYNFLSCVHTVSQMFPAMCRPKEIYNFIQGSGVPVNGIISPLIYSKYRGYTDYDYDLTL